jgi:hypothetical protein
MYFVFCEEDVEMGNGAMADINTYGIMNLGLFAHTQKKTSAPKSGSWLC